MAHAESRVTTLFEVHRRAAESKNEKIPQALFRSWQIMRRIDRP